MALLPALISLGGCTAATTSLNSNQSAVAQESGVPVNTAVNTPALASVLTNYVDDRGLVDYASLQADRQSLDAYNASLELTTPETYNSWSEPEQIAFLITASEPRIHAALVCAALSCAYLRQEPFTGENLDAQLDDQAKIFISRPEAFEIDRENNEVRLSAIFDWFGQDWVPAFGGAEGFAGSDNEKAVLNFISGYLNEEDSAFLKAGGY